MTPVSLSPAQQRRLERLAKDAGRTSGQMLKFVLRDGFEYCEWQVRESLTSDAEAKHLGATAHETVMREAQDMIDSARGRRRRQAA
jgi:predicted DNA-binding protein